MAGESAREVARRHQEKIERLQRSQARWEKGAVGEEAVAAELATLPAGWTVLHDVAWPGRPKANIDHVVIGPGGVFVIDTKNWSGSITVDGDVLRQDRRARESTVAAAAEAALAVARLTSAITVNQVNPVLCFVGDEPLTGWARDVMVTSTSTLVSMLLSRPLVVHPTRVAQVSAELRSGLVGAGVVRAAAPGGRVTAAPAPRRREVLAATSLQVRSRTPRGRGRSRRRRDAGRGVRQLVALIGFVAACVWGLPQLPSIVDRVDVVDAPEVSEPSPSADALSEKEARQLKKARKARRAQRSLQTEQPAAP